MSNRKKVTGPSHVAEGEDGAMTAVLLLFRVDRGGKAYTLKIERNYEVQDAEAYEYTIAREAGIRDSQGDALINTWRGAQYSEWTEAVGAGLEAIDKLAKEIAPRPASIDTATESGV